MKVLIVASGNGSYISPFIIDQINSLKKQGIRIELFFIKGGGVLGYVKNYKLLVNKINLMKPDIVHAHYGLSGLLSVLQRGVPVVTTFHGSDINVLKARPFSIIADKLSSKSIFVSHDLAKKIHKKNPVVIPCGVDMDVFYPMDKADSRKKLGLSLNKKYLLFSSSFSNKVKNSSLALEAISRISNMEIELLELKGYKREEVALLMNAVDAVLLTSISEGSPQFIKEAMACNKSIISTDVGDVREVVKNTNGCYIAKSTSDDIADKIQKSLGFIGETAGRKDIEHLDNMVIVKKIKEVYNLILIKKVS